MTILNCEYIGRTSNVNFPAISVSRMRNSGEWKLIFSINGVTYLPTNYNNLIVPLALHIVFLNNTWNVFLKFCMSF